MIIKIKPHDARVDVALDAALTVLVGPPACFKHVSGRGDPRVFTNSSLTISLTEGYKSDPFKASLNKTTSDDCPPVSFKKGPIEEAPIVVFADLSGITGRSFYKMRNRIMSAAKQYLRVIGAYQYYPTPKGSRLRLVVMMPYAQVEPVESFFALKIAEDILQRNDMPLFKSLEVIAHFSPDDFKVDSLGIGSVEAWRNASLEGILTKVGDYGPRVLGELASFLREGIQPTAFALQRPTPSPRPPSFLRGGPTPPSSPSREVEKPPSPQNIELKKQKPPTRRALLPFLTVMFPPAPTDGVEVESCSELPSLDSGIQRTAITHHVGASAFRRVLSRTPPPSPGSDRKGGNHGEKGGDDSAGLASSTQDCEYSGCEK